MKFGLSEATVFKSFFNGITNVADEITFYITPSGLRCQTFSRGNVMIFDVTFNKDYFDIYEVESDDYFKVVPKDILDILKTVKKDDHILFDVDAYEMHILIEGSRRRNFNLSLIDDYDFFRDIPSLEYSIEATARVDDLIGCVKDLDLIGSGNATLKSEDGELKCFGDNTYKGNVVLSELARTTGGDGASNYGKANLEQVLDFKDFSEMVELRFGESHPLECKFYGDDVVLMTMVAPIFDNEED